MQYRVDFLVDGAHRALLAVDRAGAAVRRLRASARRSPAGRFGEALVVVGWFTLLQGVLEGAVNPSLTAVVEHIRKGTLDFVLLKPADAQFLVSTARFEPWRVDQRAHRRSSSSCYAFHSLGQVPSPVGVLPSLVLLVHGGAAALLALDPDVSAAFCVVKVDNLTYLFSSIFDAARWPVDVFRGALRIVFTFVIPLALMTTFPAEALLGRLPLAALVRGGGGLARVRLRLAPGVAARHRPLHLREQLSRGRGRPSCPESSGPA